MKTKYKHPDLFAVAQERQSAALTSLTRNSNRVDPDFIGNALEAVRQYALTHEYFLAEDIVMSHGKGHDGRVWGSVMHRAKLAGYIENAGYGLAISSNNSPKVKWKSLIYQGDAA